MAYEKIVVGTDGSETSLRAVKDAAQLARSEGAELVILHVGDSEEVLRKAQDAAGDGGRVSTRAEKGDPSEVLIQVAESENADLLVVGNRGMTGASRFLMGSVPNKISHHAPCDLLIVRTSKLGK